MHAPALIARLEAFPAALTAAVACVSADDARWKPVGGAWSILEVVCHLADEEVLDFRTRVLLTLRDPTAPWPAIDPEGWARDRRYNEQDLAASTARFCAERSRSIGVLRALPDPLWATAHPHPKFGPIGAGDLLTSWAAHDALHLRQIAKRIFELAQRDGAPFKSDYAGNWTA